MKALFVIPHYFQPVGSAPDGRTHGSFGRNSQPRVEALTGCLNAIRAICQPRECILSHADRQARLLSRVEPMQFEIIICTVGVEHLLNSLSDGVPRWTQSATTAAPPLLGYECHAVLRDRLGTFDYYCFLEDDILLTDPWMFRKLDWFRNQFGESRLLQPNRFETGSHPRIDKMYVDGELPAHCTAGLQPLTHPTQLSADVFGKSVMFRTTTNPHAGCFFLSAAQMERWVRAPYFLDRSTSFIGALESAATLGIMRTFEVFKAGEENPNVFEVRHFGTSYLGMVSASNP